MRTVLELCATMNEQAGRLYETLADVCPDAELHSLFRAMSRDEVEFSRWWLDLIEAWEQGLLPDMVNDTTRLEERLGTICAEVSARSAAGAPDHDCEQMLALAARLELTMIDPVFDEIVNLTEPAMTGFFRGHLQEHLQRLITVIKTHYTEDSLEGVLAEALSRVFHDSVRLSREATHDVLTGLYNRRAFTMQLPQWLAWSARYGHPFAMLLIDVDGFKQVNDRYGHAAGDEALTVIGEGLKLATRASDLVIRYGGDEFAVFAPETGEAEYLVLSSRIARTIRALPVFGPDGTRIPLTVSIGGAVVADRAGAAPRHVEDLLALADCSLYSAKAAGRDRIARPSLATL